MIYPQITVLMSVYNGQRYLKKSIESILNQTCTDFEFIIFNDGSTDSTSEILNQFDDPRIVIISNPNNIGLTKSLNIGLRLAKGELIARMDADDISLPHRFEKQILYLSKHSEVVVVGTNADFIDSNGVIIGNKIALLKPTFKDQLKNNQIIHGSVMFRKSKIISEGGYNEFFRYVQDYELWLRIAKKYPIQNVQDTLYQLRMHTEKIGVKKIEETALYAILSIKLAKGEISNHMLNNIVEISQDTVFPYLNSRDRVFFYSIIVDKFFAKDDMHLMRQQYLSIFLIKPYDIINIFRYLRTFFGKAFIIRSNLYFQKWENYKQNIFNLFNKLN